MILAKTQPDYESRVCAGSAPSLQQPAGSLLSWSIRAWDRVSMQKL